MRRLAIGYGEPRRPGWTTLDARDGDIVATIPPLPEKVIEEKWDVIEWIHGPASLYPWEAERVFRQLFDALDEDGTLIMETPNASIAAAAMASDPQKTRWVYGDPQSKDPLIMNHWAYTPQSLTEALRRAGFQRIEIKPAQHHYPPRDFRIEAQRCSTSI